jgi:hypothetical protein
MAYALRNRQVFSATVNGREFNFTCYTQSTSYGFRHICTLGYNNTDVCRYIKGDIISKATYYNRTWERFQYETVLRQGIDNLNESKEVKQALHDILIDGKAQAEHEQAEKEIQAFQNLYNQTSQEFKDRIANSGIVMNSDSDVQAVKGLMLLDILMNK